MTRVEARLALAVLLALCCDRARCDLCAAGKKLAPQSDTHCTDCSPGYSSFSIGNSATTCYAYAKCYCGYDKSLSSCCSDYPDTRPHPRETACPPGQYPTDFSGQKKIEPYVGFVVRANTNYYYRSDCVQCPAGKYTDIWGKWEKTYLFQPYFPEHECISCGVHTYQTALGATACIDCAHGKYAGVGATVCNACGPGKYEVQAGGTLCADCAAGTYSAEPLMASCTQCALGTYTADTGQTNCTACPTDGYSRPLTGATACRKCAPDKHVYEFYEWTLAFTCNSSTDDLCTTSKDCVDATHDPIATTNGQLLHALEQRFTWVDFSSYQSVDSVPLANYAHTHLFTFSAFGQDWTGNVTPELTIMYTYEDASGQVIGRFPMVLIPPSNFVQAGFRQSMQIPAFLAHRVTTTSNGQCIPGSQFNNLHPSADIVAHVQLKPLTGAPHTCSACEANEDVLPYALWDRTKHQRPCVCTLCQYPQQHIVGTLCAQGIQAACSACAPGEYLVQRNSLLCAQCPAGTHRNASTPVHACRDVFVEDCASDAPMCTPCVAGEYADPGSANCTLCAPGSFSQARSPACTVCPVDTYANTSGATGCLSCSAYTYTPQPRHVACRPCVHTDAGSAPAGVLDMRVSTPVRLVHLAQPASRTRAAASPDGRCWALVLEDLNTSTGMRTANVHVLGPALTASSHALPHGAGDVQVAVTNAALYVALANGAVLRAPVSYDCVPGDLSTVNLTQRPGHEFILFVGTQDAFMLYANHTVREVDSGQEYAWPLAHRRLPWRVQTFVTADGGDALGVIVRDSVEYTRVGDGLCSSSDGEPLGALETVHADTRAECEDACTQLAPCLAYALSSAECRLYRPGLADAGFIDAAAAHPDSNWSCFRANATTRRVLLHRNATHAQFQRAAENELAHVLDDWHRGLASTPRNLSHALVYLRGAYRGGAYPRVLRVDTAGTAQAFLLRGCFEPEVRDLRAWAHSLPYTYTRLTLGGYVQSCTLGAFFNATHCVQCPINTFSDSHYATACTPCPTHAPHAHAGSFAATECFRARGPRAHDAYVDRELGALQNEFGTQHGVRAWEYPLIPHNRLEELVGASFHDLRALVGEHLEVP